MSRARGRHPVAAVGVGSPGGDGAGTVPRQSSEDDRPGTAPVASWLLVSRLLALLANDVGHACPTPAERPVRPLRRVPRGLALHLGPSGRPIPKAQATSPAEAVLCDLPGLLGSAPGAR